MAAARLMQEAQRQLTARYPFRRAFGLCCVGIIDVGAPVLPVTAVAGSRKRTLNEKPGEPLDVRATSTDGTCVTTMVLFVDELLRTDTATQV